MPTVLEPKPAGLGMVSFSLNLGRIPESLAQFFTSLAIRRAHCFVQAIVGTAPRAKPTHAIAR
jgi:hypothetical protein